MKYKTFTLDKFQEKAIKFIEENKSVMVSAPTGTGKTLIADYAINKYKDEDFIIIYTSPIKALSNQKFKQFKKEYGEENVGLLTGDVVRNPKGKILIMTTEIYRNMLLVDDPLIEKVKYVIFDEIHYITDRDRGSIWEESIIFSPKQVRFLCLSATIPNAKEFANWIQSIKKHKVEVVINTKRAVPLTHEIFEIHQGFLTKEEMKEQIELSKIQTRENLYASKRKKRKTPKAKTYSNIEAVKEIINRKKTPALVFCFSRKKCEDFAKKLSKTVDLLTSEQLNEVNKKIIETTNQHKEIITLETTKILLNALKKGIGFHHAGLLPQLKELVEDLFTNSLIKILYTTETFAVGINMPAKAVCFDSLRKYDGVDFRLLNTKEFYQIAGRAGRRGIDKEGLVISMMDATQTPKSYINYLFKGDTEPIKSQFKLSYNTTINLVDKFSDKKAKQILENSYYTYQNPKIKYQIFASFKKHKKILKKYGYFTDEGLTEKGRFLSKIYTEDLIIAEIFSSEWIKELDNFKWFYIIAMIVYEPKRKDTFERERRYNEFYEILDYAHQSPLVYKYLKNKNVKYIYQFLYKWYNEMEFIDLLKTTSLSEGDLIRFFRQCIDVLRQIMKASEDENIVTRCFELIHTIEREFVIYEG